MIELIEIALFANFLTWWFSPLDGIRNRLVNKMVDIIVKYNMLWAQPLITVFTCPKCLAFWASLIYTMNLGNALICALLASIIKYILKYVESESN